MAQQAVRNTESGQGLNGLNALAGRRSGRAGEHAGDGLEETAALWWPVFYKSVCVCACLSVDHCVTVSQCINRFV